MLATKEELDPWLPKGNIGGDIVVLWVISSLNSIQYFCRKCQDVYTEVYQDENKNDEWYKFSCRKIRCDATRKIQLKRFTS